MAVVAEDSNGCCGARNNFSMGLEKGHLDAKRLVYMGFSVVSTAMRSFHALKNEHHVSLGQWVTAGCSSDRKIDKQGLHLLVCIIRPREGQLYRFVGICAHE